MFRSTHMHHIQKAILIKLANSSFMRFSELQPPHVPNNTFSYHLKRLLEAGYIEASPLGYTATRKALKIIQDIDSRQHRITRPVALTVLYITNDQGEVLLLERGNRPFKDWRSVPSGIIHGGESLKQAAVRELYEKTLVTVEPDQLNPKGVLDFRYLQQDSNDMFIHAIGFIFTHLYTGARNLLEGRETKYGTLFWSHLTHANVLPEVYTISELISQKETLIQSIDFEEPVPIT